MGKSAFKFLVYCILAFVLFFKWLSMASKFGGRMFLGEFFLGAALFVAFFICAMGYFSKSGWGERGFFFIFFVALLDIVFVWVIEQRIFLLPLFASALGFVLSLPKPASPAAGFEEGEEEPKVEIIERVVAKKNGKVYHLADCGQVKKIPGRARAWFNDRFAAEEKGLEAHACVA